MALTPLQRAVFEFLATHPGAHLTRDLVAHILPTTPADEQAATHTAIVQVCEELVVLGRITGAGHCFEARATLRAVVGRDLTRNRSHGAAILNSGAYPARDLRGARVEAVFVTLRLDDGRTLCLSGTEKDADDLIERLQEAKRRARELSR